MKSIHLLFQTYGTRLCVEVGGVLFTLMEMHGFLFESKVLVVLDTDGSPVGAELNGEPVDPDLH